MLLKGLNLVIFLKYPQFSLNGSYLHNVFNLFYEYFRFLRQMRSCSGHPSSRVLGRVRLSGAIISSLYLKALELFQIHMRQFLFFTRPELLDAGTRRNKKAFAVLHGLIGLTRDGIGRSVAPIMLS